MVTSNAPGAPAPAEQRADKVSQWRGFALLLMGVFIVNIDVSVADVILPAIVQDLHIGTDAASLVVVVYMLVTACLIVPLGSLGDRIGAKPVYAGGIALFGIGSLLAGLAPTLAVLLGARVVQGVGAAMLIPSAMALLNHAFPEGPGRKLAFGLWATAIGAAIAIGPLIGGAITDAWSWRAAFFVNVPLVAVSAAGVVIALASPAIAARTGGFDLIGLVLIVLGLFALVAGFQAASSLGVGHTGGGRIFGIAWPFARSPAVPLAVLGLVLLVLFWRQEERRRERGGSVIFETAMLAVPRFRWALIAATLMTGPVFILLFATPLFGEFIAAASVLQTGLLTASIGVGLALGGPLVARLATLGERRLAVSLILIQGAGCLLLILLTDGDRSIYLTVPALILAGLGWGGAYAVLVNIMLSAVPQTQAGAAAGAGMMARLVAGAIATAVATSILFGIERDEARHLDTAGATQQTVARLEASLRFAEPLHPPLAARTPAVDGTADRRLTDEVRTDMLVSVHAVFAIGAGFALLAALAAWRIPRSRWNPPREP
ncbi:MFS transporter [Amorphus orientalis]|uniref:MFS family permease n=1 Tax=Amorphus orientalis TaxID=649198 RepID=A0AAE3VST0_9HYPH|nr:MFS transporter [Amorphus orientalis]MDQ0317313.1 MFS family permease [Amorphus orientalis]